MPTNHAWLKMQESIESLCNDDVNTIYDKIVEKVEMHTDDRNALVYVKSYFKRMHDVAHPGHKSHNRFMGNLSNLETIIDRTLENDDGSLIWRNILKAINTLSIEQTYSLVEHIKQSKND